DNLPYGTYQIKEIGDLSIDECTYITPGSNATYVGIDNVSVVVDGDDSTSNKATLVNQYYENRKFKIIKRDGNNNLSGAIFAICSENGNVLYPNLEVNDNGTIEVAELDSDTSYVLKETKAPAGYILSTDEVKFHFEPNQGKIVLDQTIPSDSDFSVDVNAKEFTVNNTKTSVKVSKVDAGSGDELPGAKIEIWTYDERGNEVQAKDASNNPIEWVSTDEPHEIVGLETNKTYILKENVAPDNYQLTTDTIFTLDEYGKVITNDNTKTNTHISNEGVLLVEDWPTGSVKLSKLGYINENCTIGAGEEISLKGVEFTLTKKNDDAFTPIVKATNDLGNIVFDGLDYGTYEIKESKAADGYILDDAVYTAEITPNGGIVELVDYDGNVVPNGVIYNDVPRANIHLKKVSLSNNRQTLPGSMYGLFVQDSVLRNRAGTLKDSVDEPDENGLVQIAYDTTDLDGLLKFDGVLTGVEYTIKELASPYGYYVSENPISIEFTADNNGAVSISSFDNGSGTALQMVDGTITWLEPEIEVSFAKQDMQGEYLPGAELKVVDKNGDDVISWTSSSEAYVVNGEFIAGETYSLVEVKAPDGYKLADPVTFTIPEKAGAEGADIISVVMKDEKISESSETPKKDTPSKTPSKNETPAEVKTPTKSETPTTTVTKSTVAVDTGDHLPVKLIVVLLAVALIGFVSVIIIKKRVNR
ncbi:MAG: hypothetical protein J6I58_08925, partial [Eubacterium sp.]|nr:hypothetical protein [Eubacterium sp.]